MDKHLERYSIISILRGYIIALFN